MKQKKRIKKRIKMSFADWYCSRCSLQFDKKIIFDMHLSIVHKESVEIKEETLAFENKPNLSSEKIKVCDIRDSKFEAKKTLNQHIASDHKDNKSFKCDKCDHSYSNKGNLNKHVKSVHERNNSFKCEICGYTCHQKESMSRHVASVHEGKKPFECSICATRFARKAHLNAY